MGGLRANIVIGGQLNPLSIAKKHAMEEAFKRNRVKHDDWTHNVWRLSYRMQQRGYWHVGHCLLRHPQPHSNCRRAPSVLYTCWWGWLHMSVNIASDENTIVWNVSLFANQSTCSSPFSPLEVFCPQKEKRLVQLHTAEDALFQQASCCAVGGDEHHCCCQTSYRHDNFNQKRSVKQCFFAWW